MKCEDGLEEWCVERRVPHAEVIERLVPGHHIDRTVRLNTEREGSRASVVVWKLGAVTTVAGDSNG